MTEFSQNDLVQVTREIETTEGVVDGGARTRVYGTGAAPAPGGEKITSPLITGLGAIQSVRPGLRFSDFSIPSVLVFGLNDLEVEDFMREAFPAALKVTDGTVDFNNAGTHLDGSTGPTIVDPAVAGPFLFADWYQAAEGAMVEVSGAGPAAPNKWPRMIKAVKSDGKQIDLDPAFITGGAGEFGEPLTTEAGVVATLDVGQIIKNRGAAAARSVNFESEFTDQTGGSFFMVRGCRANSFRLGWEGKNEITLEVGYLGMDYDDFTEATQGSGVVNDIAAIDNDLMVAGEDLAYFVVNGSVVLSGDCLTAASVEGTGSGSGVDNISGGGRGRKGVTLGDIDFTGSLTIYHKHLRAKTMTSLGRAGNKVPLAMKFMDPAGNFYWGSFRKVLFDPMATVAGSKGSLASGQFPFSTQLGGGEARTFTWQRFAAA